MRKSEIDAKISVLMSRQAVETDVSSLRMLNQCIEALVMMEPEPDCETCDGSREVERNLDGADVMCPCPECGEQPRY